MTTPLSRNFSLEEFTRSDTAISRGIDNTPTAAHLSNMKRYLAPGMEQVREVCGNARIVVHVAYRNPEVNRIVGGTGTSAHPLGYACDFHVEGQPQLQTYKLIRAAMKAGRIKVDQLIFERSRGTIHASFDPRGRGMAGLQAGAAKAPIDWSFSG